MKVTVLGSGAWGTALAMLLTENGHAVTLWSHRAEESAAMAETGENPKLPGVRLPDSLSFSGEIACVRGCPMVVVAVPSFAVRETARLAAPWLDRDAVMVLVSKGIEQDTLKRLSQVLREEVGERHPVAVLMGPSHAEEVSRRIPTSCVAACRDQTTAEWVQDLFMNPRFRVYASPDVVGVELAAALKNVIALCAGVSDGLGFGDNTKAMLMTRGLTEMARLGAAMGGRKETFAGLTGVGDLIVTCTSMHSRNRWAGILLGQGKRPEEAIQEVGAVVEGYYAAASALALAEQHGVEMPITRACCQVLYEGRPVREVITELMTREKKHEIEESWI